MKIEEMSLEKLLDRVEKVDRPSIWDLKSYVNRAKYKNREPVLMVFVKNGTTLGAVNRFWTREEAIEYATARLERMAKKQPSVQRECWWTEIN